MKKQGSAYRFGEQFGIYWKIRQKGPPESVVEQLRLYKAIICSHMFIG